MSNNGNSRSAAGFEAFAAFSAVFSIVVGLLTLAGPVFGLPILTTAWPGLVATKANTSLCFVLLGLSLWLQRNAALPSASRAKNLVARLLAGTVAVIGLLSLAEFVFHWRLGIDQLFFMPTAEEAIGSIRPGLMSPVSAADFILLGLALILLDWTARRKVWPAQFLCFGAAILSAFTLLDFIVMPHAFYTHISLPSVVTLCILSLAPLCARPERIRAAVFAGMSSPGPLPRRIFTALIAPSDPVCQSQEGQRQQGKRSPHTLLLRYALAVLAVAVATVLRYFLGTSMGFTLPYMTFFLAVMLAAVVGGTGPGIVATLLSAACADYLFLAPMGRFGIERPSDALGLALFSGTAVLMSLLAGAVDRTRKRSEEILRQASAYNRSLIDASLDPLVTIAPDGKITDVNRATENITGLSRQELIGTEFLLYFTEPERARAGYQQAFREGSVQDYTLEIRHRDAHTTPVLYNASAYRDEAGEVVGVFAAARDITERQRAEEVLRRGGIYNRNLIEASLDPLVTIAPDGKIADVNRATERVTGFSRQDLIGSDFSLYFTEPERARAGYQQAFREGSVQDYSLEIRQRGGRTTPVLFNASVYRDEAGEVAGVFAAAWDITELKRAQADTAHQAAALARSNEELAQFAYVASHDLQEPLRKIIVFGDRLRAHSGPALDEDGRGSLERMQNAARRMGQLINSLLELSRVTTKGKRSERVDLNETVREVLADLEARIQESGGHIEVGPLPTLVADPLQMHQLFQNLIGNALKFRRSNVPPVLRVNRQPGKDGAWEIHVADNGIGFEEKYLDRIFRPFQRLHGRSEYEGSGMGLAICSKIVDRHGGIITANSQPGSGSDFVVTLPVHSAGREENEHEFEEKARHHSHGGGR